mgnify:CR=1 FL=1
MNKKLEDYNIQKLKALAYDAIANIELQQNNLKLINQVLGQRVQDEQKKDAKVSETKA